MRSSPRSQRVNVEVPLVCEAKHLLDKLFLFLEIWEPAKVLPDSGSDELLCSCFSHLRGPPCLSGLGPWFICGSAALTGA